MSNMAGGGDDDHWNNASIEAQYQFGSQDEDSQNGDEGHSELFDTVVGTFETHFSLANGVTAHVALAHGAIDHAECMVHEAEDLISNDEFAMQDIIGDLTLDGNVTTGVPYTHGQTFSPDNIGGDSGYDIEEDLGEGSEEDSDHESDETFAGNQAHVNEIVALASSSPLTFVDLEEVLTQNNINIPYAEGWTVDQRLASLRETLDGLGIQVEDWVLYRMLES